MPFLNTILLDYLISTAGDYDAVVPRLSGFIEPLHSVYARSCIGPIKEEMSSGSRNIRSFFSRVNVKYVESDEVDRFDPGRLSFFNINSENDLAKAREIAKVVDGLSES
jgi:molybdopterin-guanine dinucleotide biosynthesis protein A